MRERNLEVFKSRISNEGEFVKSVNHAIDTGTHYEGQFAEQDQEAPKIRWQISGINSNEDLWTE